MNRLFALLCLGCLFLCGCGDKKPGALNAVEDAAAKKAKSVENFAKDRLEVKD